jgi:hypothetical protein
LASLHRVKKECDIVDEIKDVVVDVVGALLALLLLDGD